jgi:hypothetical protein
MDLRNSIATMKTTGILLLLTVFFIGCNQKGTTEKPAAQGDAPALSTIFTLTTKAAYLTSDSTTKLLIEQTNAAIQGLRGLTEFNPGSYKNYGALFTLTNGKVSNSFLTGSIIMMSMDDAAETEPWQGVAGASIKLCQRLPNSTAIAKIPAYMADKRLAKMDVLVTLQDSCVLVSY